MKAYSSCTNCPPFADCQVCSISLLCLPLAACPGQSEWLSQRQLHLTKNTTLCKAQLPFTTLYLVKSGALKAYALEISGKERVIGFYLPGEIIGLEAIAHGCYPFTIQTVANSQLCEITFDSLQQKIQHRTELQLKLLQLASQRLHAGQCLRYGRAEQRIVSFLMELAQRLPQSSEQSFILPISRQDIGDYLGLACETVIRLMSRLQQQGYLRIRHRQVHLTNLAKLEALLAGQPL